jgi:sensor c-di-GMP phosphodiesterase-like protein
MELISQIILTFGGFAACITAAGWLATKFIENRLNREIENYKASLKTESDKEIEKLKVALQVSAKDREIAVNWLHQKRAGAIETIYGALVDLQFTVRSVLDFCSSREPEEIRRLSNTAMSKLRGVYTDYVKAKIFLSPDTCVKIELVINHVQDSVLAYHGTLAVYDDHELSSLVEFKNNMWQELNEHLPQAISELESDFRKVLSGE